MSLAKNNIIEIDSSSYQYTGTIHANGWVVITNADNAQWTVENVDKAKVIHGESKITNERVIPGPPLAKPTVLKNLKVERWTNIDRIVIYLASAEA